LNIGLITTWFSSGAGYVSRNYQHLLAQDHEVYIYARGEFQGKRDSRWNNPNVTWAPYHPSITGIYHFHYLNWLKSRKIDLVLFNEQRFWDTVVFTRKLGILCGAYVDYYTANTIPFYNLFDFLICNTKRHYSQFSTHPQCIYIPWGFEEGIFKPKTATINETISFLISAGWTGAHARTASWLDRRGCGLLLNIFKKVKGDCRLLVFSQAPLEKCPQDWQEPVKNDPRITFTSGTFEPFPYANGDVYIYPSRLDGLGLTLSEALVCGLPAITTNSPPMNEFVQDQYNGLLVDVKEYHGRPDGYYWAESICDEDSLVNAIEFYIQNPEKVIQHGKNALEYAKNNLNWSKNGAGLSDWVTNQKILTCQSSINIDLLCRQAIKHDYQYNPTPGQKIVAGIKEYILQAMRNLNG
jgi:1,2-diacylglycerol 3-alpha-glucosyltransferase